MSSFNYLKGLAEFNPNMVSIMFPSFTYEPIGEKKSITSSSQNIEIKRVVRRAYDFICHANGDVTAKTTCGQFHFIRKVIQ